MADEKKEIAIKSKRGAALPKTDEAIANFWMKELPRLGPELVAKGINPVASEDVHAGN